MHGGGCRCLVIMLRADLDLVGVWQHQNHLHCPHPHQCACLLPAETECHCCAPRRRWVRCCCGGRAPRRGWASSPPWSWHAPCSRPVSLEAASRQDMWLGHVLECGPEMIAFARCAPLHAVWRPTRLTPTPFASAGPHREPQRRECGARAAPGPRRLHAPHRPVHRAGASRLASLTARSACPVAQYVALCHDRKVWKLIRSPRLIDPSDDRAGLHRRARRARCWRRCCAT